MHSFKLGVQSLREGITHARVQYWCARHYRRLSRERAEAFAQYRSRSPRGLHIGAQAVHLKNWFNTDLDPRGGEMYYLDATQLFPFPDHSFDFVFSEHMIEHIPFAAGLEMLRECRRVLKPCGVVRTATPNLKNILALSTNHNPDAQRYLQWAVETFSLPPEPYPKAPMVINNFFRSWGHQFLYDPETLHAALAQAGFRDIVHQQAGVSSHAELRGLEHHGDTIGEWVNQFETMVFEGMAPHGVTTPAMATPMEVAGNV
jgi:predicted SAM-dependent methyltransferase